MVEPRLGVRITKHEGKSWWVLTVRVGHRKYEGDLYFLGARYRIASLQEQLDRTTGQLASVREELDEYQGRFGFLDSPR